MLRDPRFTQSNFTLYMSRKVRIQDRADAFFEVLRSNYFDPEPIDVPSDANPEIPRIRFQSQHGFSQILISETSVVLIVRYSVDWQEKLPQAQLYLAERSALTFDLVDIAQASALFCGMTTSANLSSTSRTEDFLPRLADLYGFPFNTQRPHDVFVKITTIVQDRYFSNITVQNYRTWSLAPFQQGVLRFPNANAVDRGVEVVVDFNDRYAFNEDGNYSTSREAGQEVITNGLAELSGVIERLRSEQW